MVAARRMYSSESELIVTAQEETGTSSKSDILLPSVSEVLASQALAGSLLQVRGGRPGRIISANIHAVLGGGAHERTTERLPRAR